MRNYISPWLYTTMSCPLDCEYCYVPKSDRHMGPDMYDKILNDMHYLKWNHHVGQVHIRLSGGEPLWHYQHWPQFVTKFRESMGQDDTITLMTSLCMPLFEGPIEMLVKNRVAVATSLDGTLSKRKKDTGAPVMDSALHNIDKLISAGMPRDMIVASTVYNNGNHTEFSTIAEKVARLGISWGIYLDHFTQSINKMEEVVCEVSKAIDILRRNEYDIERKFKFNNISLVEEYNGCTAGTGLFAVTPEGRVYPCQTCVKNESEFPALFNMMSTMRHTMKWVTDMYRKSEKYRCLDEATLSKECVECSLAKHCHGSCKLHQKNRGQNAVCLANRRVMYKLLDTIGV